MPREECPTLISSYCIEQGFNNIYNNGLHIDDDILSQRRLILCAADLVLWGDRYYIKHQSNLKV